MYNPSAQHNRGYTHYRENQFTTADRGKILLMMYDGAIRFIGVAKKKIVIKNRSQQGTYIGKAIAVITELSNSLDMQTGGDVAISLDRLYNYLVWELTNANMKNSAKNLDSCIRILTNLKEAWVEVINQNISKTDPANGKSNA